MSKPKTKEETDTIRVPKRVKGIISKKAKEKGMSVPDYMNTEYPEKVEES